MGLPVRFPSMKRALSLAEEPEVVADIWYNLGHIGINLGTQVYLLHNRSYKLLALCAVCWKLAIVVHKFKKDIHTYFNS